MSICCNRKYGQEKVDPERWMWRYATCQQCPQHHTENDECELMPENKIPMNEYTKDKAVQCPRGAWC